MEEKIANNINIGTSGEDRALSYLKSKGFELIARNIRYKWGEIDLVVKKGARIHFVEVKARKVIHETPDMYVSPEDNMTQAKLKKLFRAIEVFLNEIGGQDAHDWQLDLITVIIKNTNQSDIEWYQNIEL